MIRQFVYPSQALTSSTIQEISFKIPKTADVWACAQSSLNLVLLCDATKTGLLNANGLLPLIKAHKVMIDGKTVLNDVDISSYSSFNVRSRVNKAIHKDVVKFQVGANDKAQLTQVIPDTFDSVTSSTFELEPDTFLTVRPSDTNNNYVCSIPLQMISNIYSQSMPLYLINGDIEIVLILDLTAGNVTLPLTSSTASTLTLSQAYIFSAGFSYANKKVLPDEVRHTFTGVQTSSLPCDGSSNSFSMNLSLANERIRRLFIQYRSSVDAIYGLANSKFDASNVYPTLSVLIDNMMYWNKPLLTDYQVMQYTSQDSSIYGYTTNPGTMINGDATLMSSASVPGTSTAYNTSAGKQNVAIINFGEMPYSEKMAGVAPENSRKIGNSPVQILISAPSTLTTATVFAHAEVQRDIVFSRGVVALL